MPRKKKMTSKQYLELQLALATEYNVFRRERPTSPVAKEAVARLLGFIRTYGPAESREMGIGT